MKHSLLSLTNHEGVSLYQLTDKLHTSRKAIIHAIYELQEQGYHIYVSQNQVYYFEDKSGIWPYVALIGLGVAFIYAMILAVV